MKKLKTVITISQSLGSDFQAEIAYATLYGMLTAWAQHLKQAHKKNIVSITYKPGDFPEVDLIKNNEYTA